MYIAVVLNIALETMPIVSVQKVSKYNGVGLPIFASSDTITG